MDQTSEIYQNSEMEQTPEMDQNLEMDQNPSYEVFSICRSCNLVNLRFYWSGIYPNLIRTPFRMFKENLFDHQVDQVLLLLKQTLRKVGRRRLKCFSFQSTTFFFVGVYPTKKHVLGGGFSFSFLNWYLHSVWKSQKMSHLNFHAKNNQNCNF